MNCAACGHANRAGRRFCTQCGATLAPRCPDCGHLVEQDERFCAISRFEGPARLVAQAGQHLGYQLGGETGGPGELDGPEVFDGGRGGHLGGHPRLGRVLVGDGRLGLARAALPGPSPAGPPAGRRAPPRSVRPAAGATPGPPAAPDRPPPHRPVSRPLSSSLRSSCPSSSLLPDLRSGGDGHAFVLPGLSGPRSRQRGGPMDE